MKSQIKLAAEDYSQTVLNAVWCDQFQPFNMCDFIGLVLNATGSAGLPSFSDCHSIDVPHFPTSSENMCFIIPSDNYRIKFPQIMVYQPKIRALCSVYNQLYVKTVKPLYLQVWRPCNPAIGRESNHDECSIDVLIELDIFHYNGNGADQQKQANQYRTLEEVTMTEKTATRFSTTDKILVALEIDHVSPLNAEANHIEFMRNVVCDVLSGHSSNPFTNTEYLKQMMESEPRLYTEEPLCREKSRLASSDACFLNYFQFIPVDSVFISKSSISSKEHLNIDNDFNTITLVKCLKYPKMKIYQQNTASLLIAVASEPLPAPIDIGLKWALGRVNHEIPLNCGDPFSSSSIKLDKLEIVLSKPKTLERCSKFISDPPGIESFLKMRRKKSGNLEAGTLVTRDRAIFPRNDLHAAIHVTHESKSVSCIANTVLCSKSDLVMSLSNNHVSLFVRPSSDWLDVDLLLDEQTGLMIVPFEAIRQLSVEYLQLHLGSHLYSTLFVVVDLFSSRAIYPFTPPMMNILCEWLGRISMTGCKIHLVYSFSSTHMAVIIKRLVDHIGKHKSSDWWERSWLQKNETAHERFLKDLGFFNSHSAHVHLSKTNLRQLLSDPDEVHGYIKWSQLKCIVQSKLR